MTTQVYITPKPGRILGCQIGKSGGLDSGGQAIIAQPPVERKQRRARLGLRGGPGKTYSATDRFWSMVVKGESCWLFQGRSTSHSGHKHFFAGHGKRMGAHKFSWLLHNGPIPVGQVVCHHCDVPACVNPEHLFLGTQWDNVRDSRLKQHRRGLQKLNEEQVYWIRAQAKAGRLHRDIAADLDIARNTVSQIVNRVTWQHLPAVTEAGVCGPTSEPTHVDVAVSARRAG